MKTWFAAAAALLALAAPARAWGEDAPKPTAPDLATPAPAATAQPSHTPGVVLAEPVQEKAPEAKPAEKKHGFFPIWGDKVRAKGFELPPPYGFMVNYYYQETGIDISNLQLGFNGGTMRPYDFIQFSESTSYAQALAIRPNVMVLPFLSIYGVLSSGSSSTDVNISAPVEYTTVAESGALVFALGATFQMGWKGWFVVADFNAALADVDRIADYMGSNLLSFRLGKAFALGPGGRKLAVWAGTAGQVIDVSTEGSVKFAEVIDTPSQGAVDQVQARCDELPIVGPRREACEALVGAMQDWVDGTEPSASVQYSLDKVPSEVWNMIVGANYTLDPNWQLRAEFGFLGTRTSALLAVEYRFDIVF